MCWIIIWWCDLHPREVVHLNAKTCGQRVCKENWLRGKTQCSLKMSVETKIRINSPLMSFQVPNWHQSLKENSSKRKQRKKSLLVAKYIQMQQHQENNTAWLSCLCFWHDSTPQRRGWEDAHRHPSLPSSVSFHANKLGQGQQSCSSCNCSSTQIFMPS